MCKWKLNCNIYMIFSLQEKVSNLLLNQSIYCLEKSTLENFSNAWSTCLENFPWNVFFKWSFISSLVCLIGRKQFFSNTSWNFSIQLITFSEIWFLSFTFLFRLRQLSHNPLTLSFCINSTKILCFFTTFSLLYIMIDMFLIW